MEGKSGCDKVVMDGEILTCHMAGYAKTTPPIGRQVHGFEAALQPHSEPSGTKACQGDGSGSIES